MNARINSDEAASLAAAGVGLTATPTRYSLVQVAANTYSGVLNSSGQIALTQIDESGRRRAGFYDGATLIPLGTLGGEHSEAAALNARGQVVGRASVAGGEFFHAYRWSQAGGMVDLGALPGHPESAAFDINNAGEVTGYSGVNGADDMRAVRWTAAGAISNLGTLGGPSYGLRINDAGRIAGGSAQAFSWTAAEGMIGIAPPGSTESYASDLNAAGQIAGTYVHPDSGLPDPFLWTPNGGALDLGDPGNTVALNDAGMVAGISFFNQTAFVWTPQGGRVEIGSFPGGSFMAPMALNNQGQVVGLGWADGARAFLWTAQEGLVDLNTRVLGAPAGLVLEYATSINERGQIVAIGNDRALYLLQPGGAPGAPLLGAIQSAGIAPVALRLPFSASFQGGTADYQAEWSWGDGSSTPGVIDAVGGKVAGEHRFMAPGIYMVRLTLRDASGRQASAQRTVVVAGASGLGVALHPADRS